MTDLGKVSKDKGPDPDRSKRKKDPDSDSFREMMKVGKVREVDPEEKRKRKSRNEAEEEIAAQPPIPHQGLDPGESSESSIYTPKAGDGSSREGIGRSEDYNRGLPPPRPPPRPPSYGEKENPQIKETTPTGQKRKKKKSHRRESPPPIEKKDLSKAKKPAKMDAAKKGAETKFEEPKAGPNKAKESEKSFEKDPTVPPKADSKLPLGPEGEVIKKIEPKAEATPLEPLPKGSWESVKGAEKEKKKEGALPQIETGEASTQMPQQMGSPGQLPAPSPLASSFAHLPAQVVQIFERMVGVMTVMNETGVTQTTIDLSNPKYANSVFFGSQIVISEFSSAPKEFNIELVGNIQAVEMMNANVEELVAAFQAGKYNFKVNRIDTSYQKKVGEAKRKELTKVKRKKTGGG